MSEGVFSVTYNQYTGEYKLHIDNHAAFSELREKDGGYDTVSAKVDFTLAIKNQDGVTLTSKTIDVKLKFANDVPELKQVDDSGNEITDIVVGAEGSVKAFDVDQGDTATYQVFIHEEINSINKNDRSGDWINDFTSLDKRIYNEANLDAWMERYTEAVGEAGTISQDKRNSNTTFLKIPNEDLLGSESSGSHGTFSIDPETGAFHYTVNDNAFADSNIVQETFHIIVKDSRGAFDIKDVTFLSIKAGDDVLVFNGNPKQFSSDFDLATFIKNNIPESLDRKISSELISTAEDLAANGFLDTTISLETQKKIATDYLQDKIEPEIRELGRHGKSNFIKNETGSVDGTVAGSFVKAGFENQNCGIKFELTPTPTTATANGTQYIYSDPDPEGWVTITYVSGIDAAIGDGKNTHAELPEGTFSVTYNQYTGEYKLHIDNDSAFSQLKEGDNGITKDAWKSESATVDFTLVIKNNYGVTLNSKTFDVKLKFSNDIPELKQVDKFGNEITDIVADTVGYVKAFDVDQGDTATYQVLTKEVKNNGTMSGKASEWIKEFDSDEKRMYNEANLDAWMEKYTEAVGEAGTSSTDKDQSSFLKFANLKSFLKDKSIGSHGTLTIDTTTGKFEYTLNKDPFKDGNVVQDTFHIVVFDIQESFDIKDVTFLAIKTDAGVKIFNGNPKQFGDDFDLATFVKNNIPDDTESTANFVLSQADADNNDVRGTGSNDLIIGAAGDDTLLGDAGTDLLFGGVGNDELHGGAGNDYLNGDAGDDKLYGDAGDDFLFGSTGDDTLQGGAGDDTLQGGAGNDTLQGDAGDDLLFGGLGDDKLDGGADNDYLDGGSGADEVHGGMGYDLIVYDNADSLIDGGEGIDFLVGDGAIDALLHKDENSNLQDIEAAIESVKSLTNMQDLADLGVSLTQDGSQVSLNDDWTQVTDQFNENFDVYTHTSENNADIDATLVVAKHLVETGIA